MKRYLTFLLIILVISPAYAGEQVMPSFEEVKKAHVKSEAYLLDRHGNVIHELRVQHRGRRLEWVGLQEMSPALIRMVLASEDRHFYQHGGVDWMALGSAMLNNAISKTQRGASTITMQLAGILDKSLAPKKSKRSIPQKWDQMKAAWQTEKRWKKDEILEAYLNLISYRGELQGIAAASKGLFGKDPHGLDETEAAILAALIRSPNAGQEAVARRACILAGSPEMTDSCSAIRAACADVLAKPYAVRQSDVSAPHVAHALLRPDSKNVVTTLDKGLQQFSEDALKRQLIAVMQQNVHDGAVLVVDNQSGDILAYVGSSGLLSRSRHVDGVRAKRQAGSTLKPFIYATAFEERLLTAASIIEDMPLDVPTEQGIYRPENYARDFKGMVSARTALASSLNIPAVKTLSLAGIGPVMKKLRRMGIEGIKPDEYYGLSMALGSIDVSLYELVNAYRTLANRGVWTEHRLTDHDARKKPRKVFDEAAAFIVSDILSDRVARSLTFGLENQLATSFWSAVKTGTSKDMRDNWCIGFSDRYTVGVWVGNFSGEPMWNVSGVTGAAPVWREIMTYLHRDLRGKIPTPPGNVVASQISFHGLNEPGRKEFFLKGTEPAEIISRETVIQTEKKNQPPQIVYPAHGTVFALDPDIPSERQRIFFEANPATEDYMWVLDGKDMGSTSLPVSWQPEHGMHTLSIIDHQGRIAYSVDFVVKGRPEKLAMKNNDYQSEQGLFTLSQE